ncbi:YitT family protein [Heliobacterium chlorum]|uniref:YitT family protein n=1 Tax=Heliobacterium chlorum TaxID=2698 RepID=A0ABR7SYW1_HELCL|nr:YitT family protein [Heliobacterium chlorum]
MKETLREYALVIVGALFFAIGTREFILPSKLAPGGVAGLATLVYYMTNISPGILMSLINLPLYILAYRNINREFVLKTFIAVTVSSTFIDWLRILPDFSTQNILLNALYGGLIYGTGVGLIARVGGSLGGVNILAKIYSSRLGISFGTLNLTLNSIIVLLSGLFIGHEAAMYTIVAFYASNRLVDFIQEGLPKKAVTIISKDPELIAHSIMEEMGRGVTFLKGEGAFTHDNKNVILCAIEPNQLFTLKKTVYRLEPNAFIIISDAKEILGRGFRPLTPSS